LDDQGRLLVFFNEHGGPNPLYFLRSEKPEDIGSWSPVRRLALNDTVKYNGMWDTYTYTNPVRLSEENGRIYLFWRGMDNKPNYAYSDDDGDNWSKGKIFILPERTYPNRRPYLKVYSNGRDIIHFAFTDGHPRREKHNSIYHMFYRDGGLYRANGDRIGNLGDEITPRMADCVYDAIPSGEKAWIWDVAEDESGNPVLAYVKFPDDENHIYCYASWDGRQWNNRDLVNAGKWFPETQEGTTEREPNYSGGMNLDHENPNTVYLSVNRDSVFEIEQWVTTNGGKSWKASRITHGSSKNNVRPFAVRGATGDDPLQVLWMCNTKYVHYTDYHSSIQMGLAPGPVSGEPNRESILDVMHHVADWQVMDPRDPHPLYCHYGAFDTGLWAPYKTTGEERYKNEIWNLLNDIYHADRLTAAQSFAELCMAPPAFARIYKATDEQKYLDYMIEHWWETSDDLYSAEDYPGWERFIKQFKEVAAKLLRIQDEDGLWRVSLNDPEYLDIGESSGAFLLAGSEVLKVIE
jgi:hypothetical protein